jgi:hypothetical protein
MANCESVPAGYDIYFKKRRRTLKAQLQELAEGGSVCRAFFHFVFAGRLPPTTYDSFDKSSIDVVIDHDNHKVYVQPGYTFQVENVKPRKCNSILRQVNEQLNAKNLRDLSYRVEVLANCGQLPEPFVSIFEEGVTSPVSERSLTDHVINVALPLSEAPMFDFSPYTQGPVDRVVKGIDCTTCHTFAYRLFDQLPGVIGSETHFRSMLDRREPKLDPRVLDAFAALDWKHGLFVLVSISFGNHDGHSFCILLDQDRMHIFHASQNSFSFALGYKTMVHLQPSSDVTVFDYKLFLACLHKQNFSEPEYLALFWEDTGGNSLTVKEVAWKSKMLSE